ncbi:MAG TPA: hypothetical protein PK867_26030, partial [Pirellulales bacterium]|nr:hypothetical protein [Pirellulales bacterium]
MLVLDCAADRLYEKPPRVGMVVGTYAAVPYIHMQLEARRRLFPDVPMLVHDDGSPAASDLKALCDQYGADFEANSERLPHHLGDMSAFVGGLKWAQCRQIELLLKVSRRWIFLADWTEDLRRLAMESQQATFSNYTQSYAFGFRTECVALAVRPWASPDFFRDAVERINLGRRVFVEGYLHAFAIKLHEQGCAEALRWTREHPVHDKRRGYAAWPLMGTDRKDPNPSGKYLWHDSHSP